jgi:hypothetical protein
VANRSPRELSESLFIRVPAGTLGRIERLRARLGHGQAELVRRLLLPALASLEAHPGHEGEDGAAKQA